MYLNPCHPLYIFCFPDLKDPVLTEPTLDPFYVFKSLACPLYILLSRFEGPCSHRAPLGSLLRTKYHRSGRVLLENIFTYMKIFDEQPALNLILPSHNLPLFIYKISPHIPLKIIYTLPPLSHQKEGF